MKKIQSYMLESGNLMWLNSMAAEKGDREMLRKLDWIGRKGSA